LCLLPLVSLSPLPFSLSRTIVLKVFNTTLYESSQLTFSNKGKYVIWPRIDQKSCLKCIATAGLIPVVIANILEGDELRTDLTQLESEILRLGADSVVAVLTTTSCFAPRAPDRVVDVSKICKRLGVPHVINNAYGVQDVDTCKNIEHACKVVCA
jgi:O-phospho-L-seryl-tRNASec:L-selenocysteinyl-tRNA synthase